MIKECFVILLIIEVSLASISYQLYTRNNPKNGQPLIYKNLGSVDKSNYNGSKKSKIIIHGYGQNGRSDMNRDLKNAFLEHDDYNVIVADWSSSAGSSYDTARNNVEPLAKSVAKFIDWMGLDEGRLHVIGYDLGAHIAGIAGKNTLKGRIDKITGLDPNKDGFNPNASANRLSAGDARFVEVYHSNGGKLGLMGHIANTDMYINDGKSQPECKSDACSHYRSVEVYLSMVSGNKNKYGTYVCETIVELDGRGCGYDPREWFDESSGLKQIITTGK